MIAGSHALKTARFLEFDINGCKQQLKGIRNGMMINLNKMPVWLLSVSVIMIVAFVVTLYFSDKNFCISEELGFSDPGKRCSDSEEIHIHHDLMNRLSKLEKKLELRVVKESSTKGEHHKSLVVNKNPAIACWLIGVNEGSDSNSQCVIRELPVDSGIWEYQFGDSNVTPKAQVCSAACLYYGN